MATTQAGYPQLTSTQCLSFALRALRNDFLSQPPQRRTETLARVQRLLEDERQQRRNQPSYLAQHAKEIYGL